MKESTGKSAFKKIGACIPLWTAVVFAVLIVSLVLLPFIHSDVEFAESVNSTCGTAIRFVLTKIFDIFPFSFVEILLICSPILVYFLVRLIYARAKKGAVYMWRTLVSFLAIGAVIMISFVFGYEASYYGHSVEQKIGFERRTVTTEELEQAAYILLARTEAEIPDVKYPEGTYSSMDCTFAELNDKLNVAYARLVDGHPALDGMTSRAKPVILSEPWTYTHISGLYSFFTGEANVNVNYPDFIIATSAAHEMAHQRGTGKEDEADFIAYLVCTGSDDAYLRYAGNLEFFRSVMNQLYDSDRDAWTRLWETASDTVRGDLVSFSRFFDKYRENVAAQVNDVINDTYIQAHNQPAGVKTYDLVTELVVSYVLYAED